MDHGQQAAVAEPEGHQAVDGTRVEALEGIVVFAVHLWCAISTHCCVFAAEVFPLLSRALMLCCTTTLPANLYVACLCCGALN